MIHLSTFAPTGSVVAAPTTSLPECIGGDLNYDYRFAWIRDASLAMAMMALLGDTRSAAYFMGWLARRSSSTDSPIQIMYRLSGDTDVSQHEQQGLRGWQSRHNWYNEYKAIVQRCVLHCKLEDAIAAYVKPKTSGSRTHCDPHPLKS
ncbi:glycoside hydrolase family 15 protein [Nitrospira sp. Nam74]